MKRLWPLLFVLLLSLIVMGGTALLTCYYHYHTDTIPPGVEISGELIGGLEKTEALTLLEEKFATPEEVEFKWEEETYSAALPPEAVHLNLEEVVKKASNPFVMVKESQYDFFNLLRFVPHRSSLNLSFQVSTDYLLGIMERLRDKIERDVKNARLDIVEGVPIITEEELGRSLKVIESLHLTEEYLKNGVFEDIPLKVEIVEPLVKSEDFPDFSQKLAAYETPLNNNNENRRKNIKLASQKLNGHIVNEGEVFSFNDTVGRVTASAGYKKAPIIENLRYSLGLGGGICQVSTTLYQAALRSGLEIKERSNHSRPVTYVPLGLDAAISYDQLDLKFKNNKDFSIIITAVVGDQLRISIYGEESLDKEIEVVSEKIATISPRVREKPDPELPEGESKIIQKGRQGYRVKVYRLWLEKGEEVKRKAVSTDLYHPVEKIVNIGVAEEPEDK